MAETQANDGKITIYGLGRSGVIIDVNPLDPGFPEDSLRLAQNATHELTAEHLGALRKRPGLAQFNLVYAGGPILGGIPMAIAGTGGAPSTASGGDGGLFGAAGGGDPTSGSGSPGDSGTGSNIGAGDGSGSAGGTFSGGAATFGSGGAGGFNSGSQQFGGARLVMIGFIDNTSQSSGGIGWFVTNQGATQTANVLTPGASAPGTLYSYPPTTVMVAAVGQPCAFYGVNGYFYYQAQHNQVGSVSTNFSGSGTTTSGTVSSGTGITAGAQVSILQSGVAYLTGITSINGTAVTFSPGLPVAIAGGETLTVISSPAQIYRTNGGTPTLVATIPRVAGTSANAGSTNLDQRTAVTFMHWAYDGNIYVCVKDKADGQNTSGNYGRVFQMDANGGLVDINTIGGLAGGLGLTAIIPYTCALFDNKLYIGEFDLASSEAQSTSNLIVDIVASDYKSYKPFGLTVSGGGGGVSCMLPFPSRVPPGQNWTDTQAIANRILFVGTAVKKAASPPTAHLYQFTRDAQAVGTITLAADPGLGDQGTAGDGNMWVSLVDFQGKLYASYFNKSTKSNIYQFTPNFASTTANGSADGYWDGSGTWANVLSGSSLFAYYLFNDNNQYLYAVGLQGLAAGTPKIYASPDGVTWTDQSANLPAGASSRVCLPFLFGANQ